MFETGTFVAGGDFDAKRWRVRTDEYVLCIERLTHSKWIVLLGKVRKILGQEKRRASIQQGPPPDAGNNDLVIPDSDPVYQD